MDNRSGAENYRTGIGFVMNPTLESFFRDAQEMADRTFQAVEARLGHPLDEKQKSQFRVECITYAAESWCKLQALLYGVGPVVIVDEKTGKVDIMQR